MKASRGLVAATIKAIIGGIKTNTRPVLNSQWHYLSPACQHCDESLSWQESWGRHSLVRQMMFVSRRLSSRSHAGWGNNDVITADREAIIVQSGGIIWVLTRKSFFVQVIKLLLTRTPSYSLKKPPKWCGSIEGGVHRFKVLLSLYA